MLVNDKFAKYFSLFLDGFFRAFLKKFIKLINKSLYLKPSCFSEQLKRICEHFRFLNELVVNLNKNQLKSCKDEYTQYYRWEIKKAKVTCKDNSIIISNKLIKTMWTEKMVLTTNVSEKLTMTVNQINHYFINIVNNIYNN